MQIPTMTQGSLRPDLEVTIYDAENAADFSSLSPAQVHVICEVNGVEVVDGLVDSVTPSTDGKAAIVKRAWVEGDTDTVGHMWVWVVVEWGADSTQYFPADGPMRLDITRNPDTD